jgi:uncharacterized membrane protein (DUF2068 family)
MSELVFAGSASSGPPAHRPHRALLVIGAFKLVKATLLVILATGALRLVHHNVADVAETWIRWFRLDPGNHYLEAALVKLAALDDGKLRLIGAASFVYALLFCVEGIGLCLRKRWAEYVTVVLTASALPLEVYELWREVTPPRIILLVANLAILAYLIVILRHDRRRETAAAPVSPES